MSEVDALGIKAAGWAIVRIVDEQFRDRPVAVDVEFHHWAAYSLHWELTGPALIAKCASSLASVLVLMDQRRTVDLRVLLRSLYESVLSFAWLAIDPELNTRRWLKSFARTRLAADSGMSRLFDHSITTPIERQLLRDVLDLDFAPLPTRELMAREADDHWYGSGDSRLCRVARHYTFGGMYEWVYRSGSSAAHADLGLICGQFIRTDGERACVQSEPCADQHLHSHTAVMMMFYGLIICAEVFGWPSVDRMESAMSFLPNMMDH